VIPRIILSDTEVSSEEDDVPLQRRMRQFQSGVHCQRSPAVGAAGS
jgi:hypothetical protein